MDETYGQKFRSRLRVADPGSAEPGPDYRFALEFSVGFSNSTLSTADVRRLHADLGRWLADAQGA